MSSKQVYTIKVSADGSLDVPVQAMKELKFTSGTLLVVYQDGNRLVIERKEEARARLKALAPKLPSVSQFIAERRNEPL